MSRYHSYLNSAAIILSSYKGDEPFSSFTRKFFALNKKYGSADRKMISHLCYCHFRTVGLFKNEQPGEIIVKGLFLCSDTPSPFLEQLKPSLNVAVGLPLEEKLKLVSATGTAEDLFPFPDELSKGVDRTDLAASILIQPDLFLRIRPGKRSVVLKKLEQAGLSCRLIDEMSIALPNGARIESVLELDKEAVVQDLSSQRVGAFIQLALQGSPGQARIWDCCAASGGKAIMAYDLDSSIQLTVSDIRQSIMANLTKRFGLAGIRAYRSFIADLSGNNVQYPISNIQYSLIIADVPCSGSGTWGRTPEQLGYFRLEKIDEYVLLQKKILANVVPSLQPGGHLLYITCSVFRKENEEAVEFLEEKFHLRLVKMELLKGYSEKGDTMFAALLQKPL